MSVRLDRVALNVGNLRGAMRFYCEALGFGVLQAPAEDGGLAALLGVRSVEACLLKRGGQVLELSACDPPGAPVPADGRSNDLWFQHCALVTRDMAGDYERLREFAMTPISRGGPQSLPGGIVAFKFRDPEGHPLELIAFPRPDPATAGGIDHSAISVSDVARSIGFYELRVGLPVRAKQVNRGAAQDALDDLEGAIVDVVALAGGAPGPHLELLGYRAPVGRAGCFGLSDLAASRLVFAGAGAARGVLRDPDGHVLVV